MGKERLAGPFSCCSQSAASAGVCLLTDAGIDSQNRSNKQTSGGVITEIKPTRIIHFLVHQCELPGAALPAFSTTLKGGPSQCEATW